MKKRMMVLVLAVAALAVLPTYLQAQEMVSNVGNDGLEKTISFDVASFTDIRDKELEDVMNKMPGISADAYDGAMSFSYNGMWINKIYVNGLDVLEGNYAPVYNMKPEDVERLEVTENHVDVKVMKGVQYSNNVAINVVLKTEPGADKGELELLFVLPEVHSKGIGQAAWKAVEALHPEIRVWETITPYFEKRNIHFYVNRCGFQIVEFWNKHFHGPQIPEDEAGNWEEDDEMFLFRKVVK